MALRIIVIALLLAAIAYATRRIWRDWSSRFREMDAARRARDLAERRRADVIDLKRDKDGTYRPNGDEDR